MRKFLILIFLLLFVCLSALDTICKISGEEIECKVEEIIADDIKYKLSLDENEPTKIISKSEVLFIKYENGEKDNFYEYNNSKEVKQKKILEKLKANHKNFYIFAGLGSTWFKLDNSSESGIDNRTSSYFAGFGLHQQPFERFGFKEEITVSVKRAKSDSYWGSREEEIHEFDFNLLFSVKPWLASSVIVPYVDLGGRFFISDYGEEKLKYGLIANIGTDIYNLFFVECRFDYALTDGYRENYVKANFKDRSIWGIIGYRF